MRVRDFVENQDEKRSPLHGKGGGAADEGSQQWGDHTSRSRRLKGESQLEGSFNGIKSEVSRGEEKEPTVKKDWLVKEVKRLEKVVRERTAKRLKRQKDDNSGVELMLQGSERNKVLAMQLGEKYRGVEEEEDMGDCSDSSQRERKIEFTTIGVSNLEETFDSEVPTSSFDYSSVKTMEKEKLAIGEVYDPEVPTHSCNSSSEPEVSVTNSIFVTQSAQVEEKERDVAINTIQNVLAKLWVRKARGKAQQDNVRSKLDSLKEELIRAEKCHESLLMKEIKLKQKLQKLY